MKQISVIALMALVAGCVASNPPGDRTSSKTWRPPPPTTLTDAPIRIAWDMRGGTQDDYITYDVPETYVGKTLRILIVAMVESSTGGAEDVFFMPEDTLHVASRKGSLSLESYMHAAVTALYFREGSKGVGTLRIALYDTSDATGGQSVYGSIATVGSTSLLGDKALEIYKEQVSNMLTTKRRTGQ